MCLLPTPSGKESHKKQHCEKPRILAATPDSDAPPSKGPTEASEATEAWPLGNRVQLAAKATEKKEGKGRMLEDFPDRVTHLRTGSQGKGRGPTAKQHGGWQTT